MSWAPPTVPLGLDPRFIEHREAGLADRGIASTTEARERYRQSLLPYCQCIVEHCPAHVRKHMMRELLADNIPLGVIAFAFTASVEEIEPLQKAAALNAQPLDEQDRLAQLAHRDYPAYLKTSHWQAVRQAALARADYRCALCNSPNRLEVHHRSYERVGAEPPADVIAICDACHGRHHDQLAA